LSGGWMTRRRQLLSGRVAIWMDGVRSGHSAKTADPSTTLLRSSGRDDKERVVAYLRSCDWDVWNLLPASRLLEMTKRGPWR
jgi:hypothetical protein